MTTLVPRAPYTQEELLSLYPASLRLQHVQIVSAVFIMLLHPSPVHQNLKTPNRLPIPSIHLHFLTVPTPSYSDMVHNHT